MNPDNHAFKLDVASFARSNGRAAAGDLLVKYERLAESTSGLAENSLVNWSANGELRHTAQGQDQCWLHLSVNAVVVLTCQRCLNPMQQPLLVEQSFRFVANEETAEAQDDEAEEDVLAMSRDFNLRDLIEDELLMALPLVPRHEVCPVPVKLAVADADFEETAALKDRPFDILAKLQLGKPTAD